MAKYNLLIKIGIALFCLLFLSNFAIANVDICPTFSVSDLVFSKFDDYDRVRLKGCGFTTTEIGRPELPVQSMSVLIPPDARVDDVVVTFSQSSEIPGTYYIFPSQPPAPLDGSDPPPFVPPDDSTYNSDEPYPGNLCEITHQGSMGGYQIATINIYPLQYRPLSGKLTLHTEIHLSVRYTTGINPAIFPERRSEQSQMLIEDFIKKSVVNPDDLENFYRGRGTKIEEIDQLGKLEITLFPSLEGMPVDYVIITSGELAETFQQLADWKTKKGTITVVRTVEWITDNYPGFDFQERIREFIKDAWRQWGIIKVLLGGDVAEVPERMAYYVESHNPTDFMPTDLYYSDIIHPEFGLDYNWNYDGDWRIGNVSTDEIDGVPDIFVGRAPSDNIGEAQLFVDKVFTYEKNPPPSYTNTMLLMGASISGPYPTANVHFTLQIEGILPENMWQYIFIGPNGDNPPDYTGNSITLPGYNIETVGQSSYTPGVDFGYFIWRESGDLDKWHIVWSNEVGGDHYFSGTIETVTGILRNGIEPIVTYKFEAGDNYTSPDYYLIDPFDGYTPVGDDEDGLIFTAYSTPDNYNEHNLMSYKKESIAPTDWQVWWLAVPKIGHWYEFNWEADDVLDTTTAFQKMDQGYHIVNHYDHSGWDCIGTGANWKGGFLRSRKIDQLNNGERYSILFSLGCSPNAYDYESDCFSENFINNPNGGGVAFIGNSRIGWPSQDYQDKAFFDALFLDNIYHLGETFAKIQTVNPHYYHNYAMNLLGDPEMPIWTDIPKNLTVEFPPFVGIGPQEITVRVTYGGQPVYAWVCLMKDEYYAVGETSRSGIAKLHFTPETPGKIYLTVTSHNFIPFEDKIDVFPLLQPYICYDKVDIIDDEISPVPVGNNDGVPNPGEQCQFDTYLKNTGSTTARIVIARLTTDDKYVDIIHGGAVFGDIPQGSSVQNKDPFVVHIYNDCPDVHEIKFALDIKEKIPDGKTWVDTFIVTVKADSLQHSGHHLVKDGSKWTFDKFTITNYGRGAAMGVIATLCEMPGYIIDDGISFFGDILAGETVESTDPFIVFLMPPIPKELYFKVFMTDYFGRNWEHEFGVEPPDPPDTIWLHSDSVTASDVAPTWLDVIWDWYDAPDDIMGYNVYCSSSPAGPFEKINKFIVSGVSKYQDYTLELGKYFYYKVTALDYSANESDFSPVVGGMSKPPYQEELWPADAGSFGDQYVWGGNFLTPSAVCGDVNGDGKLEVVVATLDGYVCVFDCNGQRLLKLLMKINDNLYGTLHTPALADLNSDGKLDIIVNMGIPETYKGALFAWHGTGESFPWSPILYGNRWGTGSPSVADIDGDGELEILVPRVGPDYRILYCYSCVGDTEWTYATSVWARASTPAIGNLDADDELEIVIAVRFAPSGYGIIAIDHNGDELWHNDLPGKPIASPSLGDIDNDGNLEVVCASSEADRKVYVWNHDGTPYLPFPPIELNSRIQASPALADLNGDGYLEIIINTRGESYVYAFDYEGNYVFDSDSVYIGHGIFSSPLIGDIDGDKSNDIVIANAPAYDGRYLRVLNADGKKKCGYPVEMFQGRVGSSGALCDLDNDGDVEIVAPGPESKVYVWDLPDEYDPYYMEWPMFHHDCRNTRNYNPSHPPLTLSGKATALNNGRKICRITDTPKLWIAYVGIDKVFSAFSEDNGLRWSSAVRVADGKYPSIDSYGSDVAMTFLSTDEKNIYFSRKAVGEAWTDAHLIATITGPNPERTFLSQPSFVIDAAGVGHFVYEVLEQTYVYPGYARYELYYGYFDATVPEPTVNYTRLDYQVVSSAPGPVTFKTACVTIDNNNYPKVAWSRPIGEGALEIYYQERQNTEWLPEPFKVSSTVTPSIHPYIDWDERTDRVNVVWEEETSELVTDIKHRYKLEMTADAWSRVYTPSEGMERHTSFYPVMESDFCMWFELNPNLEKTEIYINRFEGLGWGIPENFSETDESSSLFPYLYFDYDDNRINSIWTDGDAPEPFKIRFKSMDVSPPIWFAGHIIKPAVWRNDMFVVGDATIDATLIINPGITVSFNSYDVDSIGIDKERCEFIVNEALIAEGTAGDSIIFTSSSSNPSSGDWWGIRFEDSSNVSQSILKYCIVEYGYRGITLNHASPLIRHNLIQNNGGFTLIEIAPAGGIVCYESEAVIDSNIILQNYCPEAKRLSGKQGIAEVVKNGGKDGGGKFTLVLMIDAGISCLNSACEVRDNQIKDNQYGLLVAGSDQGNYVDNLIQDNYYIGAGIQADVCSLKVEGNKLLNNGKDEDTTAIGLFLMHMKSDISDTSYVELLNNEITGSPYGMIDAHISALFPHPLPYPTKGYRSVRAAQNLIKNNWLGIEAIEQEYGRTDIIFTNNFILDNDSIGVFLEGLKEANGENTINLGNLFNDDNSDDGGNRIYGNGVWDIVNLDPDILYAHSNLWSSTDSAAIDSRIYDDDEGPWGMVDFSGYYTAGELIEDETWEGNIYICGDILVPEVITLTIVEGTTVRFAANFDINNLGVDEGRSELIVEGNLEIKPKSSLSGSKYANLISPIGPISSISPKDLWQERSNLKGSKVDELKGSKEMIDGQPVHFPIVFTSDAYEPSPTDWYGIELGGLNFEENGKDGLSKKSLLEREGKDMRNERNIHYFHIEYAKRGLVLCEDENLSMKDCVFRKNDAGLKLTGHSDVTIKDCIFKDNTLYGIYIGEGVTGNMKDDTLSSNDTGIMFVGDASIEIKGLVIEGNEIGAYVSGVSKPSIKESKIINNSDYGVYITDDAEPDLGGGKGHNYIFGSELYDLYNNTSNKIMAKKNYWGTMNIDTVQAHIYDYYDDPHLGIVEVEPLWGGNKGAGGTMSSGTENRFIYSLKTSPNPFVSRTTIAYSIAKPGKVSLNIYDISGRRVKTLVDKIKDAGVYYVKWNGCDSNSRKVATGVYFTRLVSGNFISVKKVILVR